MNRNDFRPVAFQYPSRLRLPSFVALLLAFVYSAPAAAQLDNDPNNDAPTGDALFLPQGMAISNLAKLAAPGNDVDYYSTSLLTGDVLIGMTTPIGDLPNTFDAPDTVARVHTGRERLTYNDDDGADELPATGFNRGSLFRLESTFSAIYYIGITGTGDEVFGNGHTEAGAYVLTVGRVNPAVLGGGFTDTDPLNNRITSDDFNPGPFQPDVIPVGPQSAHIAVAELLAGDVDFYELHLSAGQVLSAMTAPLGDLSSTFDVPDTVLGLFDSTGALIFENDDAGNESESALTPDLASDKPFSPTEIRGSALRALIPSDGTYYLAVTGFSDDNYVGDHGESGRYALLVGTIPEPGSLLLAGMGVACLLGFGERRERRRFV